MKVIPELFVNKKWLDFDWAKNIEFAPIRNYYVSSFSKTINNVDMSNNYGKCIYGYKDDKIAELLAPISIVKIGGKEYPFVSQVVSYDVIYNVQEARQEINYLCSVIDLFDLMSKEKNQFLEEIMQYWILSLKDKKWSFERERRYVLFLYDNDNYLELDKSDERFLKLKTTLFVLPDFILGNNPSKSFIEAMVNNKRGAISTKDYIFCSDCFSCDFDVIFDDHGLCPICGSSNYNMVNVTGND